jgi:hypothetical protein
MRCDGVHKISRGPEPQILHFVQDDSRSYVADFKLRELEWRGQSPACWVLGWAMEWPVTSETGWGDLGGAAGGAMAGSQ